MREHLFAEQLRLLHSFGLLSHDDVESIYIQDRAGLLHTFSWCSALPPGAASFVMLSSSPPSSCSDCADVPAEGVIIDPVLQRRCSDVLDARSLLKAVPPSSLFARVRDLNTTRSLTCSLTSWDVSSPEVGELCSRLEERLVLLEGEEVELRSRLRSWVATEYLCGSEDMASWPPSLLGFLGPDRPRWLRQELVQLWRGRFSTKQKVRTRSTLEAFRRRLRDRPLDPAHEPLRTKMMSEGFAALFEELCSFLDGELERLRALPETVVLLAGRGSAAYDTAVSEALRVLAPARVCQVDALTGMWLSTRRDLNVELVPLDAPLAPEHLEVVAALYDPDAPEPPGLAALLDAASAL